MMRPTVLGGLAICLAATLWGLDGVVLTPRLHNLDVLFVVFMLHAVPFLLMQVPLASSYRSLAALKPIDWTFLLLASLAGGLIGTFAIVRALFLVNFNLVSVVVLLQKLQPVFAILLAGLVLRERVTTRFAARAAIAVAGAYLMTFGLAAPDFGTGATTGQAAVWAVIAAAAFGSATVFGKRLLSVLDFRTATFGRYGLVTLMALVALLASGRGVPLMEVTSANWAIIVIITLTTGSGAILLYYFGLSRVPARVSAICEMCLPLSAIIFDYLVNGSVLGAWQWVGAAIMIAAITLVTLEPRQNP